MTRKYEILLLEQELQQSKTDMSKSSRAIINQWFEDNKNIFSFNDLLYLCGSFKDDVISLNLVARSFDAISIKLPEIKEVLKTVTNPIWRLEILNSWEKTAAGVKTKYSFEDAREIIDLLNGDEEFIKNNIQQKMAFDAHNLSQLGEGKRDINDWLESLVIAEAPQEPSSSVEDPKIDELHYEQQHEI